MSKEYVNVHARVVPKHDTGTNWRTAGNAETPFIPLAGELIIYDAEKDSSGNIATPARQKIGDGSTNVHELPFVSAATEDIKLSEQFTITKDFGYYKLDGEASKKVGTIGQSLHSFLQGAFAEEDTTIFYRSPFCSIYIDNYSAEIGTAFSPTASWSTGAGSYKWGTFKNGTADFADKDTGISYDTGEITLNPASITLTEEAQTVTASGTATRGAVTKYPCSNLGNNLSSTLAAEYKASETISLRQTTSFTGYRPNFCGFITSLDDKLTTLDSTTLTSEFIRNCLTSQGSSTTPFSVVTPPAKWVQFFYAVPAGRKTNMSAQDDVTKLPCAKATKHEDIEIEHVGGVKSVYTVFVISNDALTDANKMNLTWS